ncbi:MAG: corrinoid protein [Candidatus Methanomethylicia archaeon]
MRDAILGKLINAILDYDIDGAVKAAEEAINAGLDPIDAIENGLAEGIRIVGEKFEAGEVFLTELAIAAEAMKAALKILEPLILSSGKERKSLGKVVIGTVEGDIHDIGKNIVSIFLMASGFEVIDLGADVPVELFVEKVKEVKPDIVAMSALMTTTMVKMMDVIKALEREGLRDRVKVMIGGAPTSKEWAREIGADGHGSDAIEAVEVAKKFMGVS